MPYFRVEDLVPTEQLPGIERRAVWLQGVMLTFYSFAPGAVVPEHAHPNEQITLVTKGAMAFTVGSETRILHAGEGASIPPGVRHSVRVLDEPSTAIDGWSPPREDYKTTG
jgi:quercetin dioxygenase-like cupin family protein